MDFPQQDDNCDDNGHCAPPTGDHPQLQPYFSHAPSPYYPAVPFPPGLYTQAPQPQFHRNPISPPLHGFAPPGVGPKRAPPERTTTPIPDLRFLKTATTHSLASSTKELAALQKASSWFEGAHKTMNERMQLAKSIQEGCQRIVGIIEALKTLDTPAGVVEGLEGKMGELGGLGQEVACTDQEEGECGQSVTEQAVGEDGSEKTWDHATLVHLAEENIKDLRILRARWQAGGRNLEDIGGLRQTKGTRFAKRQQGFGELDFVELV